MALDFDGADTMSSPVVGALGSNSPAVSSATMSMLTASAHSANKIGTGSNDRSAGSHAR
jgi:hypothetical protein